MPEKFVKKSRKLFKGIKSSSKMIFHYSGLEFIYRKFVPSKNSEKLPNGFIWFLGIYFAMFGIAFDRHENRATEITNLGFPEKVCMIKKAHA